MFKKIFSFFSSTPKLANDIFDKNEGLLTKFGSWVGGQQFTDEEIQEFNYKFVIDTLEENTDRSKARRSIAILVIRFYISMLSASAIIFPINPLWSHQILELCSHTGIVTLVSGVALFFFGTHLLRSTKKNDNKKK